MTRTTRKSLENLIKALDEAIEGWEEYTGPCDGNCDPDWLCRQMPALKERVESALSIAPEDSGE